jgi:hypothetical protein
VPVDAGREARIAELVTARRLTLAEIVRDALDRELNVCHAEPRPAGRTIRPAKDDTFGGCCRAGAATTVGP